MQKITQIDNYQNAIDCVYTILTWTYMLYHWYWALSRSLSLSLYIYIYTHTHTHTHSTPAHEQDVIQGYF